MDLQKLWTEITTDPLPLGYAGKTDDQIAGLLNLVRTGQAGATPVIRVRRRDVTSVEVMQALDLRDLTTPAGTIAAYNAAYLESVLQQPRIEFGTDAGADNLIKDNLDLIVGSTNGSQTRLNALRFRFISRAEELGLGVVQAGHVFEARGQFGS